MAWEHQTGTASGMADLLNQLATWLTSVRPGYGSPGMVSCPSIAEAVSTGGDLQICSEAIATAVNGSASFPRWADTAGVLSETRQRLWRFEKDDGVNAPVDFWFVLDLAESGDPTPGMDHPNMGMFMLLTETVGKSAALFKSDVYDPGHPNTSVVTVDAARPNPTAPRFSSVYPTYGANLYHFFSDGYTVHVAFNRTTIYGDSWQHFSFGSIQKASGAWEGGEYVSGCCAGSSDVDCWDYSQTHGHSYGVNSGILLSSTTRSARYSQSGPGTDGSDPCSKGSIRVVGVQDAYSVGKVSNYCALGDPLLSASSSARNAPATAGTDYDAVGSAAILGGLGAWQQIKGKVSSAPVAQYDSLAGQDLCPNTWDNRAPGIGVDIFAYEDSRWQLLGSVPGVRFLDVSYLPAEGTVNTDWKVFPLSGELPAHREAGGQGNTNSGTLGVAFRFQG